MELLPGAPERRSDATMTALAARARSIRSATARKFEINREQRREMICEESACVALWFRCIYYGATITSEKVI
jgi:hypothetical protein